MRRGCHRVQKGGTPWDKRAGGVQGKEGRASCTHDIKHLRRFGHMEGRTQAGGVEKRGVRRSRRRLGQGDR